MDDVQRGPDERGDHFGQLEKGDLVGIAEVEHFARQCVIGGEPVDAVDEIVNEAEAPRLPAVTVYRQGDARQRVGDELRNDATVSRAHARAVRVENSDDARVQPVRAMVGHRQRFGEALGFVVHAPRTDRVDVAPVRFRLRVDLGIAVHLAGGGDQVSRPVRLGDAERVQGADAIDLEGVNGMPQIVPGAGGTGEMQDEVDGIVDDEWLRDVVPQEPEPGVGSQVCQVRGRPRQQVVDPDDMPVSLQEIVAEVRAEEPGGSGDQHGRGGWAADAHTYTRFGSTRRVASPRPRL